MQLYLKNFFVEGLDELTLVFLGLYKWAKYLSLASDSRDDLFPLQCFSHTNYDIKGGDFNDFFNEMLCNDISIWWHYYDNIRLSFYAHCAILAKNRNFAQRKCAYKKCWNWDFLTSLFLITYYGSFLLTPLGK